MQSNTDRRVVQTCFNWFAIINSFVLPVSLGLPKCLELNFRGFSHLKTEIFPGEDPRPRPPHTHIKTTSTPYPATPLPAAPITDELNDRSTEADMNGLCGSIELFFFLFVFFNDRLTTLELRFLLWKYGANQQDWPLWSRWAIMV